MANLVSRIENSANQYNPITRMNMNQTKGSVNSVKISLGNTEQDHATFSATGKKLNFIINDKNSIQWNTVLDGSEDKNLKTADEYISRAGTLLEQMLKITEAAKNESLSVEERLAMQTEIGKLQHEMNIIGKALGIAPGFGELDFNLSEDVVRTQVLGSYENSPSYRMLRRAAERVAGGGEWDVREIMHEGPWKKNENGLAEDINGVVKGVHEDYWGRGTMEIAAKKRGDEIDDTKHVGRVYEVTNDASVSTVGDILKNTGRSIMDVDSAEETAEGLKRELAQLRAQQAQMAEIAQGGNEASNFLGATLEENAAKFLQQTAKLLESFGRNAYQETKGRGANYAKLIVHGGREGQLFSDVPADAESLFENKNLREFLPSTVMGRNVGINNKGIYS